MNRRAAAIAIAVAASLVLVAVVHLWRSRGTAVPEPEIAVVAVDEPSQAWRATLWLPSEAGGLAPLDIELESGGSAGPRGQALLAALLAARPEGPLLRLFAVEVSAGRVVVVDGTAYADLRSEEAPMPPSCGSETELARVDAIVSTLVRNVPEIERVVLLWNGAQREGYPGHVDTTRALVPLSEPAAG